MATLDVQRKGSKVAGESGNDTNGKHRPVRDAVGEHTGRWSANKKQQAVLRLLRGEDVEIVSRELRVPQHRLLEWRDAFLDAGREGLKKKDTSPDDRVLKDAQAKVGELTMKIGILEEFFKKKDSCHRKGGGDDRV